tara:strand:- start:1079 stop:2215 length:1137 start_codon:yes stop_codon:yes gene_type:complete
MVLSPYDQSVYDSGYKYIPQSQYLLNPFQIPAGSENEVPSGLPAIYQPGGLMGGGGGALQAGSPMTDYNNFYKYTSDKYFNNQATPNVDDLYQSKVDQTFMGMPSYRQQELTGPDMGEYIGTGTDVPLELTRAGQVQNTIGNVKGGIQDLMGKVGGLGPVSFLMNKMDRFGSLPVADQEFIKMNMGYTGPTVFGNNNSGLSKDPFGINTRSALGNYAEYVGDKSKSLNEMLSGKMADKYSGITGSTVTFNEKTGMFESKDQKAADLANKMNKNNLSMFNFYNQQTVRRDLDRKTAERNARIEAERLAAESRAESARQYDPNIHGPTNYGLGSDGQQSYDSGQGFGTNATTGGPVSNRTGRGRTDYMDGGLADMLEIYD